MDWPYHMKYVFFFICIQCLYSGTLFADEPYSVTAYGAVLSGDTLGETFMLAANFDRDYYFAALAVAKKIGQYNKKIDIELEGQIVRHIGQQHFNEYNLLIVGRWWFSSNSNKKYSLAIGEGLSYVDETSEIEALHHTQTSRLLDYLLFEFTFALPDTRSWYGSIRIHHRSGVYGLFNEVHGASNALGAGVRYQF